MFNKNNRVVAYPLEMRNDEIVINTANYLVPSPNGDEIIHVSEPGVIKLNVPENSIGAEIIYVPVDLYIRYGNNIPAYNVGAYYPEGSSILFDSYKKCIEANIYVISSCDLFIQYYK